MIYLNAYTIYNMKLVINTVNLKVGGAFQRSVSFLNELKHLGQDEYHVFLNSEISELIDIKSYSSNFSFYFFDNSPASLKYRKKIIKEFNRLESLIAPDVVFSFVGPCYWRPKTPHLVGFGIPHIVYNDYSYVKKYGLKTKLEMIYKKRWTKYEADYYVVQTQDVKERLSNVINVDLSKIYLVSNGIGEQYKNVQVIRRPFDSKLKKLLMISTYRPSKNFDIIKEVIPFLKNESIHYEFHITIKEKDYEENFKGYEKWVVNHGHVKPKDCPQLYNECDAMFLPSHLECFSASYPEAMKMMKPILTSDLSFAKTVCEDSAVYFNNLNAKEIAEKIVELFKDESFYNDLVNKGLNRLTTFDDSHEQAIKYLKICKLIKEING